MKYDSLDNIYYISDLHFGHEWTNKDGLNRGVCLFERTQFNTIEEHDKYIKNSLEKWAAKHIKATLWILGDFGNIEELPFIKELKNKYNLTINFIYGNHDKLVDYDKFCEYFDEVYRFPVYITSKILLSHEPQYPAPTGVINIHGHLHGAKLNSDNHLCVSIHMTNYRPIGSKTIQKTFNKLPKISFKFLEEPYADKYIFTIKKDDVIYDKKTGKINYDESVKLFNKIHNKN